MNNVKNLNKLISYISLLKIFYILQQKKGDNKVTVKGNKINKKVNIFGIFFFNIVFIII